MPADNKKCGHLPYQMRIGGYVGVDATAVASTSGKRGFKGA